MSLNALTKTAPLYEALKRKNALELLGAALLTHLSQESGVALSPAKSTRLAALRQEAIDCGLVASLNGLIGNGIGLNNGTQSASQDHPAFPHSEEEKEEKKRDSSLSSSDLSSSQIAAHRTKASKPYQTPSLDEFIGYARSFGWEDVPQIEDAYRKQSAIGWGKIKSWKGICHFKFSNSKAKTLNASTIKGAFDQPTRNPGS